VRSDQVGRKALLPKKGAHEFVALDGLRGVAAVAVVLYHESNLIDGNYHVVHGFLAVDFFFALSGFVLAHAYSKRLQSGMTTLQFMRLRLVRLFPLALLGWALGSSLLIIGRLPEALAHSYLVLFIAIALQFVFLPSPFEAPMTAVFPSNPPEWSLFFELIANFMYGTIVQPLRLILLVSICVASALVLAIFVKLQGPILGWSIDTLVGGVPRVVYEFFAGVLVFELSKREFIPNIRIPVVLIGALLMGLLDFDLQKDELKYYVVVSVICMPMIVAIAAKCEPSRLTSRLCSWLGYVSYGVYVLHMPIFTASTFLFAALYGYKPIGGMGLSYFLIVLGVVFLAAHLLTRYFDEPIRRHYLAFSGKLQRKTADS
jgi:peptidoglycan/LPS O-acetylase OafA/YrhL